MVLGDGPDPLAINEALRAFLSRHRELERVCFYGSDFTLYQEIDFDIMQNLETLSWNTGLAMDFDTSSSSITFKGTAPHKLHHILVGRIDRTLFPFISSVTSLRTFVAVINYEELNELLENLPITLEHMTIDVINKGEAKLDSTRISNHIPMLSKLPNLTILGGLLTDVNRNDDAGLFDLLSGALPSLIYIQVADHPLIGNSNKWIKLSNRDSDPSQAYSPEPALDNLLFGLSLDALQIYSPTLRTFVG
ncbi:hypothetical protein M422DRAFT_44333 [Sphaerobolus stellatus SS14]|nr:hypothetical protein M422DRAFT_44333 [Sphaerobolus stellatus SS14]